MESDLEIVILWVSIGSFVSGIISNKSVGLFYMLFTLPITCILFRMILEYRKRNVMTQ